MFLTVKNAVKKYGSGDTEVFALNDVSFSLEKGKILVISGPSGSGKSTLLNMLGGIDTLGSGEISVGDKKISGMNKKQLTSYRKTDVGFVFQFYNLISDLSAKENIQVVADICEKPLDIESLMDSLGTKELKNRFPEELSGGQQQRIAIARAMVKNPALLLCDEPTGALDSRSSLAVLEAIEKLNKNYGTTVVIITHNDAICAMADRVICLKDGKISSDTENETGVPASELAL